MDTREGGGLVGSLIIVVILKNDLFISTSVEAIELAVSILLRGLSVQSDFDLELIEDFGGVLMDRSGAKDV